VQDIDHPALDGRQVMSYDVLVSITGGLGIPGSEWGCPGGDPTAAGTGTTALTLKGSPTPRGGSARPEPDPVLSDAATRTTRLLEPVWGEFD
jgi:hypothetical protein